MATVLPRIWPLGETNAYLNTRKQRAQLEKQNIIAAKYNSMAKIAIPRMKIFSTVQRVIHTLARADYLLYPKMSGITS